MTSRKKEKTVISLLLAALLCALLGTAVFAATAAKIGNKKYASLQDAFNNVKSGQTIVLQANIKLNDEYVELNKKGKFTLNLNKKTISMLHNGQISVQQGNLTIMNGQMKKTTRTGRLLYSEGPGAVVTIKDGTYEGSLCASGKGKLIINGGTFRSLKTNNVSLISLADYGEAVINKGKFSGGDANALIEVLNSSSLTINGGNFTRTTPFFDDYSDTFSPEWSNGAMLFTGNSSKTIIKAGTFQSSGICLYTEGDSALEVTDGSFTSRKGGVLLNSDAKAVTIKGGTFKISGPWGLMYNHGSSKCTVSGGTFNSQWSLFENNNAGAKPTITITGGTFVSTNGKNPGMFLNFGNGKGKIVIKGGKITGKKTYGYYTDGNKKSISIAKKSLFAKTLGENKGDIWD